MSQHFGQKSREYGIEKEKIAKAIQEHQKANKDYIDSGIEKLDRAKSAPTDFMAQTEEEKRSLLKYFMENASWKGGVLESRFKQLFDVLALSDSKSETKKPLKVGSKGFNEKWLPRLDSNGSMSSP